MRLRASSCLIGLVVLALNLGAAPSGPTAGTVQGGPTTGASSVTRRAGVGVQKVQDEKQAPLDKPGPDGLVTKAFLLKYKTADDVYLLLSPWLSPMRGAGIGRMVGP